ncbi:hypothetical protein CBS101457_006080 [Exobasidium rhododendri]|nr:hypothetical protein CBS101457_006080 [Exobasidium rhododendri]
MSRPDNVDRSLTLDGGIDPMDPGRAQSNRHGKSLIDLSHAIDSYQIWDYDLDPAASTSVPHDESGSIGQALSPYQHYQSERGTPLQSCNVSPPHFTGTATHQGHVAVVSQYPTPRHAFIVDERAPTYFSPSNEQEEPYHALINTHHADEQLPSRQISELTGLESEHGRAFTEDFGAPSRPHPSSQKRKKRSLRWVGAPTWPPKGYELFYDHGKNNADRKF